MTTIKNIIGWIALIMLIILVVHIGAYRFSHPELTETQLFFKLWWKGLICAAVGFICFWAFGLSKD